MTSSTTRPAAPTTATDPAGAREVRVPRPDGRVLAVTDRGPVDGAPVVFLHAAPGSRSFDPDPEATRAAGIRLITVDRAGYGDSSPFAGDAVPTVAGHADDTFAVVEHLGLDDVTAIGWSAGGRIALALAARHPEVVGRVAVVATPAPDDEVPWVDPEHRAMAASMRDDPASALATMVAAFTGVGDPTASDAGATSDIDDGGDDGGDDLMAMVTRGGAADAALFERDPSVRERVTTMLQQAFAHGPAGVAADIVADQVAPWGFDVAAVGAPVTLVYGERDEVLTPEHGRWYADRLADATLRVVPGAGHLVVVPEWAGLVAGG